MTMLIDITMEHELNEVADHITEFYSSTGKKLVSNMSTIANILKPRKVAEYVKPITPTYYKVRALPENQRY